MTSSADPAGLLPSASEGRPYEAPHLIRLDARATLSVTTVPSDDVTVSG